MQSSKLAEKPDYACDEKRSPLIGDSQMLRFNAQATIKTNF